MVAKRRSSRNFIGNVLSNIPNFVDDVIVVNDGSTDSSEKVTMKYSKEEYNLEVIQNNGTVLCDDYDLSRAPGVKKAIDEFTTQNKYKCSIICNGRFAKIEKN